MNMVIAKHMATTAQRTLVNQVSGGEKNIMQRIATASCASFKTPGHVRKCLRSKSISSGIADSVVRFVSTLNVYFGLLFSMRVVYFRPPGPVLTVVVCIDDEPVELDLDLAMFA